ncbi:MAG: TonB-dependent receptor, partial [Bacteroidota bacterium]
SSPGTNSLFLDIVAQQIPVDPSQGLFINVRGRGPGDGFTYSRNEAFRAIAGTDLVATYNLPFPGVYNTQGPAGVPLDLIYGLVYSQLVNLTTDQINAALGVTLSDGLVATLKDQLAPQNTSVTGFSQGVLGRPNSDGGLDFIQDVVDIPPLEQTTTQTIEVGYKGIFNNKVLLAVDAYYTRKENFVGPLLFETPFVFVPGLGDDFTAALQAGIEGNPTLAALANVEIPGVDLSPENLARQIAGLAAASLPGATDPIGIVQVNENIGVDNPEVLLSYRNFGEIDLYGVDISTQILISENLDFFGSVSLVNDNFFDDEEVGEPGTGKVVALNAPSTKFKLGGNYRQDAGLSFGLSSRYVDSFPVASGPYVGTVDSYFLLDLSAGYDLAQFTPGLRVDLNVQNILNNEHRQFVGAPKLGRFTTGRITYSF